MKAKQSYRQFAGFLAVILTIYILMFIGNYLTPKVVDDFGYCYNWATGERVKSVADIAESMKVHLVYANGRIIPHSIVQFFLMFPDIVFDIINPLFFVGELLLILYYSFDFNLKSFDDRGLIIFCVFGLIWFSQPAFGQVNFWLDGSCNYLLATIIHLLFFLPYFKLYKNAETLKSVWLKILFVVFGFVAGAFSENGSAATMVMAGIVILDRIIKKEKVRIFYYLSLITSLAGYVSMVFVPATSNRGRLAHIHILNGIVECFFIVGLYLPVIAVFVITVMFLLIIKKRENIKGSLLFVFGSFLSLFMLVVVPVQSDRRGYFSVILMTIADLILIKDLIEIPEYRKNCKKIMCCFAAFSVLILSIGFFDIQNTYSLINENRQHIIECREKGQLDVKIPYILPKTKYSAIDGLKYIDTTDSQSWPNDSMAKYYSVNTIIGIPADKDSG